MNGGFTPSCCASGIRSYVLHYDWAQHRERWAKKLRLDGSIARLAPFFILGFYCKVHHSESQFIRRKLGVNDLVWVLADYQQTRQSTIIQLFSLFNCNVSIWRGEKFNKYARTFHFNHIQKCNASWCFGVSFCFSQLPRSVCLRAGITILAAA